MYGCTDRWQRVEGRRQNRKIRVALEDRPGSTGVLSHQGKLESTRMPCLEIQSLGCHLGPLRDSMHIGGRLDLLGKLRVWFYPGLSLQAQKESGGSAAAFRPPSGQPRAAALLARLSGGKAQFPGTLWHFLAIHPLHTHKLFMASSGVFCTS